MSIISPPTSVTPSPGQLAIAMDVAHVNMVAQALERAAAGSLFYYAVVVPFGIDQDLRRRRQERGDVQRRDGGAGARDLVGARHHFEGVAQNVQIVG